MNYIDCFKKMQAYLKKNKITIKTTDMKVTIIAIKY